MRSNKGITLTSLIVYITIFCIVIGTVATISGYFMSNADEVVITSGSSEQYIRLTSYLSEDINSINFKNILVKEDYIEITFLDETYHTYIFNNNKVYYNEGEKGTISKTITICEKIDEYSFDYEETDKKLKISVKIDDITYNNNYSIK